MIVRISGEGQYRLEDGDARELNELEDAVKGLVDGGNEDGYQQALGSLLAYVRGHGTALAEDELEGSDVILPPADLSFAEAREEFTGEGLIPD